METFHAENTPLAAYLEGEGSYDPDTDDNDHDRHKHATRPAGDDARGGHPSFAPSFKLLRPSRLHISCRTSTQHQSEPSSPQSTLTRLYHTFSTAFNASLRRAENTKFTEHFRYTIVASQLLNEYLDHGSIHPTSLPNLGMDGVSDGPSHPKVTASIRGAAVSAVAALVLVYLLQWARTRREALSWKSSIISILVVLFLVTFMGYQYRRRQWLKSLRQRLVRAISDLTSNWQASELSSSSALSFIQEVELVSKGYRLGTPLPPASRMDERGGARRCGKLRRVLCKTYGAIIPACIDACNSLRPLIDGEDLEKYLEALDISIQDAQEITGPESLNIPEDDPESLKSLRVLSYRLVALRRVALCSFMALEADGGKPDIYRWQIAMKVILKLNDTIATSAEKVRRTLSEMDHFSVPANPNSGGQSPNREKIRGQVRKISALSSGIRGLQAKMQILREETNVSVQNSDDLTDLGPQLMAQYESIGADLRELLQTWEVGKQSLQTNITRQERRISMTSSGWRSPGSSLGGFTAFEEIEDLPTEALKSLSVDLLNAPSSRSSLGTTASDEELVFEAVAMPRQRVSLMSREERVAKMQEERERRAQQLAKRDLNTNMLRELESVINLRPRKITKEKTPGATSVGSTMTRLP